MQQNNGGIRGNSCNVNKNNNKNKIKGETILIFLLSQIENIFMIFDKMTLILEQEL